jgi:hypothetical protein
MASPDVIAPYTIQQIEIVATAVGPTLGGAYKYFEIGTSEFMRVEILVHPEGSQGFWLSPNSAWVAGNIKLIVSECYPCADGVTRVSRNAWSQGPSSLLGADSARTVQAADLNRISYKHRDYSNTNAPGLTGRLGYSWGADGDGAVNLSATRLIMAVNWYWDAGRCPDETEWAAVKNQCRLDLIGGTDVRVG